MCNQSVVCSRYGTTNGSIYPITRRSSNCRGGGKSGYGSRAVPQQVEPTETQEEPSITQEPPTITQEETEQETEDVSPDTILEEHAVESDMTDPPHVPKEVEVEKPIEKPDTNPPQWQGRRRMFKIVNDFLLKPDETLTTLVLIAGDATIQGTVTGNVLVIGGNVELNQGGQVQGLLQVIGGQVNGNIESIENVRISNHWQIAPAVAHLLMHPHTVWDINKHRRFQLTISKVRHIVNIVFAYCCGIFKTDKCSQFNVDRKTDRKHPFQYPYVHCNTSTCSRVSSFYCRVSVLVIMYMSISTVSIMR